MTQHDEPSGACPGEPSWFDSPVERRRERRVQIAFAATISLSGNNGERFTEHAYTVSISNSGACFLVGKALPVGAAITVAMHIGTNSGVAAAEIRWAMPVGNGYRIGVSFKPAVVS